VPAAELLLLLLLLLFWAHQHKAAGLKIKLSNIKMVATASHSVTIVLWKETALLLLLSLLLHVFERLLRIWFQSV